MRDTFDMAREVGIEFQRNIGPLGRESISTAGSQSLEKIERLVELARADEREVSLDAVLRVIKELYPALVLAAFSNRDKAWAIDKIKENIEKLKETK
jgi:hypothetical protein